MILPQENKWSYKDHNDHENPYWEITNGPISLCVDENDYKDDEKTTGLNLQRVVAALNACNVKFHSENALELKQHIEIMQLQDQLRWEKDKVQVLLNALKIISDLKSFTDKEGFLKQLADEALANYAGQGGENGS